MLIAADGRPSVTTAPLYRPRQEIPLCLGVPGQITSIAGNIASLDVWGARIDVRLMGLRSVLLISWAEEYAAVTIEEALDFPGNKYFDWNGCKYYFCETTDSSLASTWGRCPLAST